MENQREKNLIERIFFGQSREKLAQTLNLPSLTELTKLPKLELPLEIQREALRLIEQTNNDGQERQGYFDLVNGQTCLYDLSVGAPPKYHPLTCTFTISTTPQIKNISQMGKFLRKFLKEAPRFYWKPPSLAHIHTHPSKTPEFLIRTGFRQEHIIPYLKRIGVVKTSDRPTPPPSLTDVASIFNLLTGHFSGWDLAIAASSQRANYSMLLATSLGYRWLFRPPHILPITIPYPLPSVIIAITTYQRNLENLKKEFFKKLLQTGSIPDSSFFNSQANQFLNQFCQRFGLICFYNENPQSTELIRL